MLQTAKRAQSGYSSCVSCAFAWLVGSADAAAGIENDGLEACSCNNANAGETRHIYRSSTKKFFRCFEGIRKHATYAEESILCSVCQPFV